MKVNNYISHGLGYMSPKEHQHLIDIGAIDCDGEKDSILCNYPVLVIKEKDDTIHIDCGGDLKQTNLELISAREKGKKCKIEFFPRAYTDYKNSKKEEKQKNDIFDYN